MIVLPKRNEADLEELSKEVLEDIDFKFVETMDEVLKIALDEPKPKRKTRTKTVKSKTKTKAKTKTKTKSISRKEKTNGKGNVS
jgi:ATP-dependent Lon protease